MRTHPLLWRLQNVPFGAPLELRCSTLFSLSLTIMWKGKFSSPVVGGAPELLAASSVLCRASPRSRVGLVVFNITRLTMKTDRKLGPWRILFKGTVLQFTFFLKSGHHGAIDLWNNCHLLKYIFLIRKFHLLLYFFSKIHVLAPQNYGAIQTLPRKFMEQCRLRPGKSQSLRCLPRKIPETSFFAPQNYGAIQTLLRKIAET